MAPDHINPAGIPVDQLQPEAVVTAAKSIAKLGKKVSKQGAAVQHTWHGLAHSYEAPEASKLFTIMDPVKSTTHSFSENTDLVAKALTTYAATEELVKAELVKIKAEAETFVSTTVANGVDRVKIIAHGSTKEHVSWDKDQGAIDKNNALIGRLEAQLTALKEAQQTCASTIYGIIGFTPPSTGAQPGGSTETTNENYVPPWGARAERTKGCGEKAADQVGHFVKGLVVNSLWEGMVKPILTMDAMLYLGYNPKTGGWFDYANSLPQYGEATSQMAQGLAKLGVGLTVLTSPGFGSAARNMPGPVGDYLRSSVKTTKDFGKSLIAYDTFKKGNIAEGLGEAVGNIGTFFIPGVGEAGAAVKGAATASKLARAGLITTEVLADGSRVTKFTTEGLEALRLGKVGAGPLSDLAKVRPNLRMPDGTKLVDFDFGKVKIPDTDLPKIPDQPVGTKHLPGAKDVDLPPSRTSERPASGDRATTGEHPSTSDRPTTNERPTDGSRPDHEPTQPHDADTPTDHGDHPATDHPGTDHPGDRTPETAPRGDGTKESPREYEYVNRSEKFRDHVEPDRGTISDREFPKNPKVGTEEHLLKTWAKYVSNHPDANWDKWLENNYIGNHGHHPRGIAYEGVVRDAKNLNGEGWQHNSDLEINGQTRNYDALNKKDRLAYEFKSGDTLDPKQLVKDQAVTDAGYEVRYVFGREPTDATRRLLENAGIDYEVYYGKPLVKAGP
jgi:hypothetical protein